MCFIVKLPVDVSHLITGKIFCRGVLSGGQYPTPRYANLWIGLTKNLASVLREVAHFCTQVYTTPVWWGQNVFGIREIMNCEMIWDRCRNQNGTSGEKFQKVRITAAAPFDSPLHNLKQNISVDKESVVSSSILYSARNENPRSVPKLAPAACPAWASFWRLSGRAWMPTLCSMQLPKIFESFWNSKKNSEFGKFWFRFGTLAGVIILISGVPCTDIRMYTHTLRLVQFI